MTTGNQQIPENLELEIAKIKAEYDVAGIKLMESYTVNGLKGLLLLNGAAAIAILAFLGDIVTTEYIRWIQGITWALLFYAIGAILAVNTSLFSYLSQYSFNTQDNKWGMIWRFVGIFVPLEASALFLLDVLLYLQLLGVINKNE